jgi:hypothetical protein
MIQIDTIKRLLAIADVARDPYTVAEAAASLLNANEADPLPRIHYARALATLGLGNAARRVVDNLPNVPSPILTQMTSAPAGTVPWTSRARRFRANLAALVARYPHYEPFFADFATRAANLELHLATDGNAYVLDLSAPVWSGWLGALGNQKSGTRAWESDKVKNAFVLPIAFDGIGYGWLFPHVFSTTIHSFNQYSCDLHLVEPDPFALALAMHIQDLQEPFSSPRVYVHLGPRAEDHFRSFIENHPARTVPGPIITQPLTRRPPTSLAQTCEDLRSLRAAARAQAKARADAYYAAKDSAHWSARFEKAAAGQGPPLRILGVTTRFSTVLQYSMAELQAAARALGHDMQIAKEPDDASLENPSLEMFADFKPDLVFQISRLRHENAEIPRTIPYVCWDQDNLSVMRTPAATASLDAFTYVAGHGANFGYSHLNWPRANVILCHPAASTHRYPATPVSPEIRAPLACDISYVSNASQSPEDFAARSADHWGPARNLLLQAAAEVIAHCRAGREWDYLALHALASASPAAGALDAPRLREFVMDLHAIADRALRHATLEWVGRWCIENQKRFLIYGKDWQHHPTLAPHAAGVAEQGEHLRAIYQASAINLQIIGAGFLHSRSLDGIAAGGFFLARHTPVDGVDDAEMAAVHRLALWAAKHPIASENDLASAADPVVRRDFATAQAYFERHNVRWVLLRALETWAHLPPPVAAIPHLADITFSTESEFRRKAAAFLGDEPLRLRTAHAMRAAVDRDFSHEARVTLFIHSVRTALAAHAATSPQRHAPTAVET